MWYHRLILWYHRHGPLIESDGISYIWYHMWYIYPIPPLPSLAALTASSPRTTQGFLCSRLLLRNVFCWTRCSGWCGTTPPRGGACRACPATPWPWRRSSIWLNLSTSRLPHLNPARHWRRFPRYPSTSVLVYKCRAGKSFTAFDRHSRKVNAHPAVLLVCSPSSVASMNEIIHSAPWRPWQKSAIVPAAPSFVYRPPRLF